MTSSYDNPPAYAIVWDLETIPDTAAYSRMQGTPDLEPAAAEEAMGDKFQKLPLHKIVCIGALIAERAETHWVVKALGAPHTGDRTEGQIIEAFVDRIGELRPQLVSFNGHGFDLPVLRYRALANNVAAPGLSRRPYFNRYSDDALDLCDVLSSYNARSRVSLDGLSRFLGLAGKPEGIDGSQVAALVKEGRIQEVADYCETDVVNTYRIWLRYELFRGALSPDGFAASEADLNGFLDGRIRGDTFPANESTAPARAVSKTSESPANQRGPSQLALKWLREAKADTDSHYPYLMQLAAWGAENGLRARHHRVNADEVTRQAELFLVLGEDKHRQIYDWLISNPDGASREEQEDTLEIALSEAEDPLDAASVVLEWVSDRMAADIPIEWD